MLIFGPMKRRPPLLDQILGDARAHKVSGVGLTAIFDLDSTLFDVSPRISTILHEFARLPEIKTRYPSQSDQLLALTPHEKDYGVRRTLERVQFRLPDDAEEFKTKVVEFWRKLFFSNDYLIYDKPYPGALEYVQDLHKAGARIMYLTGRDALRMGRGTIESLKQHGFPLDPDSANLIMKPTPDERDHDFKRDFFSEIDRVTGDVWFFENEPLNIHLVLQVSPHIKVVFLDTVHSGNAPLPGDVVPRISGFWE
jgi:hypothetical protein